MNKATLALIFGVFIIGMFSLALAANENGTNKELRQNEKLESNMTYGKCVSEAAKVQKTCYATAKTAREGCRAEIKAQNVTKNESKTGLKACDQTYKTGKGQCQKDSKGAKTECKKIKHNALDSVGAVFRVSGNPRVED